MVQSVHPMDTHFCCSIQNLLLTLKGRYLDGWVGGGGGGGEGRGKTSTFNNFLLFFTS